MEQTVEIKNSEYFIAEAMASVEKGYKLIDKYYKKNKEEIIKAAKKSEFYKMEYDGNIIQEDYFRKSLGIIEYLGDEVIYEIFKKTYKKAHSFVQNSKVVKLSKYYNILNKDLAAKEVCAECLALIMFCNVLDKEVDSADPIYASIVNAIYLRSIQIDSNNPCKYSFMTKEEKKLVRNLELTIKNKYMETNNILEPKYFFDGNVIRFDEMSKTDKKIFGLEYLYDIEGLSTITMNTQKLSSQEIQELIKCYLVAQQNKPSDDVDIIENAKNINYNELYEFVYFTSHIRTLIKEYKAAKKYYFNNINEELLEEKAKQEAELKEIKKDRILLQDKNQKLLNQLEILERENKRLKEELKKSNENKDELVQLRNFMFEQSTEIEEQDESIDIEYINNQKAICVGGSDKWIKEMKNQLPDWVFIKANEGFDTNLLNNKKYVFINIINNSHGVYYKIIANKSNSSKLKIINNNNIDISLRAIFNKLKE